MPSLTRRSRSLLALAALLFVFSSGPALPAAAAANEPTAVDGAAATPRPRIWQPKPRTTWQWQLTGDLNVSVNAAMFDVDLFQTPASTVAALKARGRKVICYINAGAWEEWRPDARKFPRSALGKKFDWPGERWLDIRHPGLRPIMAARLDMCKAKGFDGVELDNMHNFELDTGFTITYADQLAYNRWLAHAAHARGLAAGLKNDLPQIHELVHVYDFAINESCFYYDECDLLLPFIRAGKAVFHVEYEMATGVFCPRAKALGFSSMRKRWELDAVREPCR